jgi:predicted short-subunit dehydrogenase-like oxidoreductase (DUF2520 family)
VKNITYGVVGRGRVATHITRYLELESQPVRQWHRGQSIAPESALEGSDVILLAISDDALEPFLEAHAGLADATCLHFSGSRTVADAHGFHPLMTFGPVPYDHETYRAIPFVTERGGPEFAAVFPALPNPSRSIDPGQKALYHALCVLAGNFPTLLWNKSFDLFEARLGLPRTMLAPYLQQTLRNTLASGGEALTGPLARGDRGTVERNLRALEGDAYADVYRAFARAHGMQET